VSKKRTIASAAVGIGVGVVLLFLVGGLLISAEYAATVTTANHWSTLPECGKVYTLKKSLIVKDLGRIGPDKLAEVKEGLPSILG
jgi:hypothetical protein